MQDLPPRERKEKLHSFNSSNEGRKFSQFLPLSRLKVQHTILEEKSPNQTSTAFTTSPIDLLRHLSVGQMSARVQNNRFGNFRRKLTPLASNISSSSLKVEGLHENVENLSNQSLNSNYQDSEKTPDLDQKSSSAHSTNQRLNFMRAF